MLQDEANKHMIHGIRQDSGEMHSAFPRTWRLWLREINSGFKPRGLRLWLGEVEVRWSHVVDGVDMVGLLHGDNVSGLKKQCA